MDAIVNQIKEILDSKNLSASEFADLIGVKRANVSHVLSGRNKPSLEFVIRLCEAFEEIDLNTLLLDKVKNTYSEPENNRDTTGPSSTVSSAINKLTHGNNNDKEINRIILFFTDGSFKEYKNNDNT